MALAIPAFILIGLAACASVVPQATPSAVPAPTPFPTSMRPPLIIPDLGPNATQADYGERAYRLVCEACHGDIGRGLTNEWRAKWPPEDQNCWQSKCHAPNHPPDGFIVPRYVPPVLGPNTLLSVNTALQLHDRIYQTMPWQEPASLSEKEYWDITAYLVRERGLDPIREPLDANRAGNLRLHPGSLSEPTASAVPAPPSAAGPPRASGYVVVAIGMLIGLLGLAAGFLLRRARRGDA
jgi:hypothetical protein